MVLERINPFDFECANATKDGQDDDSANKPYPCAPDRYCLYCCCNPQCCYFVHRKTPKHFWEAWYCWLGIALLVIIVLSTVGTYVVTTYKRFLQTIRYGGRNNRTSTSVSQRQNEPTGNGNEISINIISTSAVIPMHRKIMLIAPQPSYTHLTPIVA